MRCSNISSRAGAIALASLTAACNAIIGVDEVELAPPDGAAVTCTVAADFDLVVSNPATTKLSRNSSGVPSLLFLLNTEARPDALNMMLYNNMGGHGVLDAPGTYPLTAGDAKLETCGICLGIYADFDSSTSTFSQTFLALAQGTLRLTRADTGGMSGRLQGLKFRRVDLSGDATREVGDGCFVTIDDVQFDMTYGQ